jgi:hypothetical protein
MTKHPVVQPADRPADLTGWLDYIGISDCTCNHRMSPAGIHDGINMGEQWSRINDDPACPPHARQTR